MSGTYALRELARADLEAIWVYTVEQCGVKQAERYLKGLFGCFEELAANPGLRRDRDDVKAGYRSFWWRSERVSPILALDRWVSRLGALSR